VIAAAAAAASTHAAAISSPPPPRAAATATATALVSNALCECQIGETLSSARGAGHCRMRSPRERIPMNIATGATSRDVPDDGLLEAIVIICDI
jgi:hypothetical protein